MSANHHRWFRGAIVLIAIAVSIVAAGCASQSAGQSRVPNQSMLDPANQALDKAVSAHADQFAPRIVGSARRHITLARDILFKAAEADRSPTDAEQDRVHKLVDQARLDARAALAKTQAGAVAGQIEQLQGGAGDGQGDQGAGQSGPAPMGGGSGLGLPGGGQSGVQGGNTMGAMQ